MVLIQISELKKFLSQAKNIKDNKIFPILSYVKLVCKGETTTLTKTNLHSFVVTEIEADFKKDITILIDEQTLSGCVNYSKGKEITISVVKGNVILNDGFREVKCQKVDDNFPSIEENTNHTKITFYTELIQSLSIAKNHTLASVDKGIRDWKCFIHTKKVKEKSFVVGVNGAISYFKSFPDDLPEISLDPDTISVISKYDMIEFSETERYDYFQSGNTTYGFIKPEIKCPALETVLDKFKSENQFCVKRTDLIDFCEMVINLNNSQVPPEVSINDAGENELQLNFNDLSGNQTATEKIKLCEKTFNIEPILFAPKNMITVMKDLKCETITVSKIFGNMIISSKEEENYIGSIMELAKIA